MKKQQKLYSRKPLTPFLDWNVVKWIVESFCGFKKYPLMINDLYLINTQLSEWCSKNGRLFVAKRVSQMRVEIHKRIFRMKPSDDIPFSKARDGLPKLLSPRLRKEIRKNNKLVIRAVLTVLSQSRTIIGGKPVDLTPIITPSSYEDTVNIEHYIPYFFRDYKIPKVSWNFEKFHFTLKTGPNGPGLASAMWDYLYLPTKLKQNLCILGGDYLETLFYNLDEIRGMDIYEEVAMIFSKFPKKPGVYSRLSALKDKEGKTRMIAILDYWSQTVLYGLHKKIFSILKTFPMDKTFNQTEKLLNFTPDEGSMYHSIDLTSATDRFPIKLQVKVLESLIGPEKAQAWKEVMVDRPFHYEDTIVNYNCGQPMGAYSSWAVFALCHHFIVYVAAKKAGYLTKRFDNYILLGDDIVIGNDNVAREYKMLLKVLGVEYSQTKTYSSNCGYEFAKRIILNHEEFSPISLTQFKETGSNWKLLPDALNQIFDRGYSSVIEYNKPDNFIPYYQSLGLPLKKCIYLANRAFALLKLPRAKGDIEYVGNYCKMVSPLFAVTWSCNHSRERIGKQFSIHMKEVLAESTRKQVESMAEQVGTWGRGLQAILLDIDMDEDYQPTFWMIVYKTIPVVCVLSEICREVEMPETDISRLNAQYEEYDNEFKEGWVWERILRPDLLRVPPTHGVVPERTSKQIARTRGNLITKLFNYIHKYRNGDLEEPQ